MVRSMCAAAIGALWFAGTAMAQQPASSLDDIKSRVVFGEIVSVVDAAGGETTGRIFRVSDASLTLSIDQARREFATRDVRQVVRTRRDSVWNGVLIGAGAGALFGYAKGRGLDSPACPASGLECGQGAMIGAVSGAIWGGVGGWIADALVRKREVVYAAGSAK